MTAPRPGPATPSRSTPSDGRTPATPKPSVQAVLDAYALNPGDVILVDGGTYAGAITVGPDDNGFLLLGSPNHPNVIQGALALNGATGVTVQNLILNGGVS